MSRKYIAKEEEIEGSQLYLLWKFKIEKITFSPLDVYVQNIGLLYNMSNLS